MKKMVEDDKSLLSLPFPTMLLADGDLLRHHHHILTWYLPRIDPTLQKV